MQGMLYLTTCRCYTEWSALQRSVFAKCRTTHQEAARPDKILRATDAAVQLVCRARPLVCGEWGLFEPVALPIPGEQLAQTH